MINIGDRILSPNKQIILMITYILATRGILLPASNESIMSDRSVHLPSKFIHCCIQVVCSSVKFISMGLVLCII